jgi:hypothetical protein
VLVLLFQAEFVQLLQEELEDEEEDAWVFFLLLIMTVIVSRLVDSIRSTTFTNFFYLYDVFFFPIGHGPVRLVLFGLNYRTFFLFCLLVAPHLDGDVDIYLLSPYFDEHIIATTDLWFLYT